MTEIVSVCEDEIDVERVVIEFGFERAQGVGCVG